MIVTAKACWIIALASLTAALGLYRKEALIFWMGSSVLLWIVLEWVAFRIRIDLYLRTAKLDREVSDRAGNVIRVMWEGRSVRVSTRLRFARRWWLPSVYADVRDLIPTSVEHELGENGVRLILGGQRECALDYRIRSRTVGAVKFAGLRLVLQDLHHFFLAERFLPHSQVYRVLPMATKVGVPVSIRKQANRQPPPGIHSHSIAGVGSELLEIRDYVPGDSPRSIAWKVSARRDALMCKQYESEVPVRCQLMVDMSRAVRLGYPGPSQGSRLVSLAATVAHTLVGSRDPVAVSIFDGDSVSISKASASRKSVVRMVDRLAGALDRPIPPVRSPAKLLLRQALDVARIRYPQALALSERSLKSWIPRRPSFNARVQMAAILANHYEMGPAAMGQLVENEPLLSTWLQHFLYDHQAPYTGAMFDVDGNYLFDDRSKIQQLANLLNHAVTGGRDNELFVIMAELTDSEYDLAPLTKAIKVARARHHRVMVVCGWPPGLAAPINTNPMNKKKSTGTEPANRESANIEPAITEPANRESNMYPSNLQQIAIETEKKNYAFHRLQAELGKLRVPVVSASNDQAELLIMNQLELVRTGRFVA